MDSTRDDAVHASASVVNTGPVRGPAMDRRVTFLELCFDLVFVVVILAAAT
jgi:low temperature requirement protein LtrA